MAGGSSQLPQYLTTSAADPHQDSILVNTANFQERFLQCHVCNENYDESERKAKMLTCGHTFCLSCLMQILSWDFYGKFTIPCPTCRVTTVTKNRNIPNAYHVSEMIDFIAAATKDTHNMCSKHRSQMLKFYCEKCTIPVCIECAFFDHKEIDSHTIIDLSKVVANQLTQSDEINKLSEEISEKLKLKTEELDNYSKYMRSLKQKLLKKVDDDFTEISSALRDRQEKLKNEISEKITELTAAANQRNCHLKKQLDQFQIDYDGFCASRKSKDVHKLLTMNDDMKDSNEKFVPVANEQNSVLFLSCAVSINKQDLMTKLCHTGEILLKNEEKLKTLGEDYSVPSLNDLGKSNPTQMNLELTQDNRFELDSLQSEYLSDEDSFDVDDEEYSHN